MISIYISAPWLISKQHPLYRLNKNLVDFGYEVLGHTNEEYLASDFLINKCDIFIAYLADKNPNVIFEVGYATALGKNILILADKGEEIPDALKNCTCIKIDGDLSNQTYRILSYLENLAATKSKILSESPTDFSEFLLKYEANPLIIDRISPLDFEYLIFELLKNVAFNPERADLVKGVGYDYIFLNDYKKYRKTLIEIKKYNRNDKVSINAVQYLAGSMTLHDADHGILITSSSFTSLAKDFVKSLDDVIELWGIEYLIDQFGRK